MRAITPPLLYATRPYVIAIAPDLQDSVGIVDNGGAGADDAPPAPDKSGSASRPLHVRSAMRARRA
ncbi:hypothetical protein SCP_0803360 [Sparassis crispa]|uniref:Uncharacterized protein n=1 Tax=Sparassis crispa TaxID=139825 RepID=A0A401GVM1_9APHY|nr:hypothetical protein SCP_0803360 [Sparassis crispa]GBE85814.1 hypothetical protein SCP_0803360 [Sparassis crispa]